VLLCATTERPPTDSPTHLSPASVVFEFSNSYDTCVRRVVRAERVWTQICYLAVLVG
jgi:hypothetical protein